MTILIVVLWIICGGSIIWGTLNFKAASNTKDGSYFKKGVCFIIVALLSGTLSACTMMRNGEVTPSDAAGGNSETTTTITSEIVTEATSADATEPEESPFEKGHFTVDINAEDVNNWLKLHGYDLEELRKNYSTESMPSCAEIRNEKILMAMREYVSSGAAGFTDGVAYPMVDALKWLYKNTGWNTISDTERLEMINRYALDPYDREIIANPIVCDMWIQGFSESGYANFITEDNEWLKEELEKNNARYNSTTAPVGNSAFYYKEEENGPLLLTDEYLLTAIRVVELKRITFVPDLDNPVQCLTSKKNWCLTRTADANLVRTKLASYQESEPAVILNMPNKNGKIVERWGTNTGDKRLMIYDVPKDKGTPPPTTTPTTTTVPVTTTRRITTTTIPEDDDDEETTATTRERVDKGVVIIKYRYWDDNAVVKSRKTGQSFDRCEEVEFGEEFEYPSPTSKQINRNGYRLKHPSDKIVRGIMNESPWEYTVWYVKDEEVTTTTPPPVVVTTTTTPPTWWTETTTTTKPDGEGGKVPSEGVTVAPNLPDDGQGDYEPPQHTTIHDYTTVVTTVPTTTSRWETDASGNVTATSGTVHNDESQPNTEIPTVTGDHFIDTSVNNNGDTVIKDSTDTGWAGTEVPQPD